MGRRAGALSFAWLGLSLSVATTSSAWAQQPPPVSEAPAAAQPPAQGQPTEIVVRGKQAPARARQESAEAVTVVDTRRARQQSADLGEVLARTQGLAVRREGGLGSEATISLNGLQDEQVRKFVDGVALEYAGYPFDLANIPVNLVERVEIYRGVVPTRYGADALGGAIDVVTNQSYGPRVGASYQVGSFGTVRTTAYGRYRHEPSGFVTAISGFADWARNDFLMKDRELPTPEGGSIKADLRRFHDGYRARGGSVEVGVVERKWAKRLTLQAFSATFDKELQHNAVMSVPYGEITRGETTHGATLRYQVALSKQVELELLSNYAYRALYFRDLATHSYLWNGRPSMPVGRGGARGEMGFGPLDRHRYEHGLFTRLGLSWTFLPGQTVRLSAGPQVVFYDGEERGTDAPDPIERHRSRLQEVEGLEYESNWWDERLTNVVFGKRYQLGVMTEVRADRTGEVSEVHRDIRRFGAGDSLRYRFTRWLLAKASYEYATRLPNADELFGDAGLVDPNNELEPEKSHNFNVGPRLDTRKTRYGNFVVDLNLFLRDSKDMIVLLAGKQNSPYSNISNARGMGVEGAASWASPGHFLTLDGSFSYQDVRNVSEAGPFEPQNGMRIPSRPYFFVSWGARLRFAKLPGPDDTLEPFYAARYVDGFDRGWDLGDPEFKMSLPAQLNHDVGVTYAISRMSGRFSSSFEVSNLTDANLFDVFGVQRAGRAYYLKLTGEL